MFRKLIIITLLLSLFQQCHSPNKPIVDIMGCMDADALNYNPDATADDGSCIDILHGCMNESSMNYNQYATVEDSSCVNSFKVMEYNTNGYAFNLDITDNLIALSANYDGTFLFEILRNEEGDILDLNEMAHLTGWEANDGDEKSNKVVISENKNLLFIMDINDRIYIHKIGQPDSLQYESSYLSNCFGDNWRDFVIDDSHQDTIYIYPLVKHSSADPGAPYMANSTSLLNGSIYSIDEFENTFGLNCSYGVNHSNIGEYVSLSDSLIVMAEGELGVTVYKQYANAKLYNGYYDVGEEFIDCDQEAGICEDNEIEWDSNSMGNGIYDVGEPFTDLNMNGVQDSAETFNDINNNGLWDLGEVWDDCGGGYCFPNNTFGNGIWDAYEEFTDLDADGIWDAGEKHMDKIIPTAQFDLPGEIQTIKSFANTVFTGHTYNKGCYMSFLDINGQFINNISIADGYNIRGVDTDGDLIVLAAGYDGILVYQWLDNTNINFIGSISSGYANSVKIKDNHIYSATRDGLEIYKLER
ncbi:MAG: hypothetical protein CMF96_08835 [Candidatus Marinimicrobia bacterium]|nr:hypothetical protein [Candidatus Neomarinimicrobiota bacterium]